MVLDEKGANTASSPWYQNSPVTVDSHTSEITFCPSYYLTKHFSNLIAGGAKRIDVKIKCSCQDIDIIAFKNPDGKVITEIKNGSDINVTPVIDICGKLIQPEIEAHSINSFITSSK